ncbi:hypothetical protein MVEN_01556400 [Mycena venus]|uniref:Uncharacterized protein n=1 Tax=Mycena venus TaxID=2733690 RepID=A0A8H7CPJ5_9AGAR|nr:hypothetical protein MVEN_01556400 [Mycena venus]
MQRLCSIVTVSLLQCGSMRIFGLHGNEFIVNHSNQCSWAARCFCEGEVSSQLLSSFRMLILLILLHLFSRNGSGAPVPIHIELDPRTLNDSCHDINNCRKLFDVVWGCLATIFACTWVSVHPNVPSPGQSSSALLWRRLKMMLIAVIAPELVVGFAGRQFYVARKLSKELGISRTHGYFFCMGGFVSSAGYPVATKQQLEDSLFGPDFLAAIQDVDAEDIMDKSKGDALSKGLALVQGLWFVAQCLARVHQHLAITALEAATLAFAVVNVFIWLLWWGKPLDVSRPIVIGPPKIGAAPNSSSRITVVRLKLLERFLGAITGLYAEYDPFSSTSVPIFWALGAINETDNTVSLIAEGSVVEEKWMWRCCALIVAAIPATILAFFVLDTAFYNTLRRPSREPQTDEQADADAIQMVADEDVRTPLRSEFGSSITTSIPKTLSATFYRIFYASIPIYVFGRLFLTALPFTALRALPPGVFMDVNWSLYIPHL